MSKAREIPINIKYVRPSFLEGMARLMDFGGTLNHYDAAYFEELAGEIRARWLDKPDGPGADAEAIHECWVQVGNSLRHVMGMPLVDPSQKRQLRMKARKQRYESAG